MQDVVTPDDGFDAIGGGLARRPLHFVWLLDVSGSMEADGKIQALNVAVREAIPHLREAAAANPGAQVLVRALAFASGVRWVVAEPTPVEEFRWTDLQVERQGLTELGWALREVAMQMRLLAEAGRGFAPALVLVSDGRPTDLKEPSFRRGLEELLSEPWGDKATRLAVGIGRDADRRVLKAFIGHSEIEPLHAENPDQLAEMLRFASTQAVLASSRPTADRLSAPTLPPTLPPDGSVVVW